MVAFLFYRKFIIDCPLSQEEAVGRLSAAVAPSRWVMFGFDKRQQPFEGSVSKDAFWIARIIRYRNSFLPALYGRFYPREMGSQIQVVVTLPPFVLVVAIGLGLAAGVFVLPILYRLIVTGTIDDSLKKPASIITLVTLVFVLAFEVEAMIARRLLERLFETNQAPDASRRQANQK